MLPALVPRPDFLYGSIDIAVEHLRSAGPVEAFDVSVLDRRASLNVAKVPTLALRPSLYCVGKELWPLVHQHQHHGHDHHGHNHDDNSDHGDLNLRSAYLHVLADAATSVLAIVALLGGIHWGFGWLDPLMGIVGAALVAIWAWGLLCDSSRVLLDAEMDAPVAEEIRESIAEGPYRAVITDLHVWRVGKGKYAAVIAVEGNSEVTPDYIRQLVTIHEELAHVSVEVNPLNSSTALI
ncbi:MULTISPECIES: cation diffusion facilitator family transporter [Comamonas]|jgi:cation diffusion facilitator family transporter|uniref:Cadmium, cobalt and zinc/H(+)-K(+) antiporter n=2 Tax=Comamonas TaxID=283 RepID=A0A8B4S3V6_COMTE|nr:cation diffusion facilitator family transporter [Comamonas thiooxydans]EHN63086.1 cation diffusion facilitator family transporter [Comamonas testosteroni ATCC 11996]PIG08928.1 cation diffusion facilitator family transporter [Comamonas sp. 26]QQN72394.1 cation transporter [Comamonas testosteroni]RDI15435.1 cation diffusion facilitator family transporter [Comamonas sp. AG1104]TFF54226.1 cation transporter [Comamonas sp. A23]TYK69108.1 cation transporter [Comamonas sp. Z1]GAO72844.1 cation t